VRDERREREGRKSEKRKGRKEIVRVEKGQSRREIDSKAA